MSSPATHVPHALFLLVPLFALAVVLHARARAPNLPPRPHARRAYVFIALLALLSILAGTLPLVHTTPSVAVAVVQALLSFFLGVPALHLASTPPYAPRNINSVLQIIHTAILVISLLGATLTALVLPSSSAASPPYLPPALFLLYSLLALLRIASTFLCFLLPLFSQRSAPSSSSSSYFFNRSSTARRPITIHIETQRTSIPLSLSSQASSAASLHFSPDNRGDLQHNLQRKELPIELELALPKRKDTRSRLNDTDGRYLYQDEKKTDTSLIEKRPLPHHQPSQRRSKSKHEKSTSVDSTASSVSTLTGGDHKHLPSVSQTLEGLASPPRAIHHPNDNLPCDCNSEPPPFSSTHQEAHIFPFPNQGLGVRSPGDIDHNSNSIEFRYEEGTYSRSRTLVVLLLAAQLLLVVGYACAVGGSIGSSSHSTATSFVSLKIVQSVTTVLAITGTMSAYLLHAYNTHLSPSRSRRSRASATTTTTTTSPPPPPPSAYKSHTTTSAPNTFRYSNPTSAKSASALFSNDHHVHAQKNDTANGYHHHYPHQNHAQQQQRNSYLVDTNTPASAVAMHHQSNIQIAETNRRPVLIQLAPPPPPRTRRKRMDGAPAAGESAPRMSKAMEIAAKARERMDMDMDVPRSVSISVSATASTRNGSSGSNFDEDDPNAFASFGSSHSHAQGYQYQPYDNAGGQGREVKYQQVGYGSASVNATSFPSDYSKTNAYERGSYDFGRYGSHDDNHLCYDYNINHSQTANANLYARPQPITLTYEPPVISGGMSLLEATETEGEDPDLDFEDDFGDEEEEEEEEKEDGNGRMEERDGNNSMDMGMNVDDMDSELDLEGEMQKALSLSRSSSSSSSPVKRRGVEMPRTTTANAVNDVKSKSESNNLKHKPKPKPKSKAKKPAEDPATYIRKRGSMPAVPRSRKLFGWEFGWESATPAQANKRGSGVGKRSRATEKEREKEREAREKEAREASFMDLKGGLGGGGGGGGAVGAAHNRGPTAPTRKLKRHSTPAGSLYRSLVGAANEREKEKEKQEKWEEMFGGRDVDVDVDVGGVGYGGGPVLSAAQASVISMNLESKKLKKMRSESASLRPVAPASASGGGVSPRGFVTASSSSGSTLNGNTGNNRKLSRSGSSTSRPGTGDSSKIGHGARTSLNSGRGLQLKRSFKLSVGRTLGPGLTLASASMGNGREEEGRKGGNDEFDDDDGHDGRRPSDDSRSSMGDEEDVDVDGEIRSISAARLVSASIARATPAATIVAAPLSSASNSPPPPNLNSNSNKLHPVPPVNTPLSSNVPQRPVLHAIVTSAPIPIPSANAVPFPRSAPASRRLPTGLSPIALSPTSAGQPPHTSGSNWKPHPFADLVAPSPATMSSNTTISSEAVVSIEDDVVLLEREIMEAIRGRRGDGNNNLMESPTIQFRELEAAMGVQGVSASPPTPLISSSMTPSLNSMFALAHAQAQTVAPPPSPPSDLTLTAHAPPATTATTTITNSSATTTGPSSEKPKSKMFGGGQPQKRTALSSPPAGKSDWGPQSSAGTIAGGGGGFPYRFPMIFPHSFTGSPPRSSSQANAQVIATPRPSTPRGGGGGGGGPTLRLSAMTMSTVRNTFAGIGARMSSATSRMSVNSTVGGFKAGNGNAFGEMVMEDTYGDFMDLRDPFASPPPTSTVAIVPSPPVVAALKKTSRSKAGVIRGQDVLDVINSGYGAGMDQGRDGTRKKMSAWGKLPVPVRSFSPAPSAGSGNASSGSKRHSFIISGRIVGKPSPAAHRKHKKERRTRKTTSPSMAGALASSKLGAEESDFGLEEALLSQRLLNRLVSDDWESRV